jgi:hypothetical protein
MNKIKTLLTWTGYAEFNYSGSVTEGTTISLYGHQRVIISASHYESLLDRFRGCTVDVGASMKPSGGSIGEWLRSHVTKTIIAPRVGAILIAEGYAERVGRCGIKIL